MKFSLKVESLKLSYLGFIFCTAFIFHKVANCSSTELKNYFCYIETSISNNSAMENNDFPLPIEYTY